MSIFYRSQYTFNKNNQNYINALIKFNKNVWITHIDGVELDRSVDLQCKDLPAVINKHDPKKQEMEILCRSADSRSTRDVFPIINPEKLLLRVSESVKNDKLVVIEDYVESINCYISYNENNRTHKAMMMPRIPSLSKDEVFLMLSELAKKQNLSGAIHLANIETIIFQVNDKNYQLAYDGNPGFSMTELFALDIDDGFVDKDADEPSPLLRELNVYFTKWKDNNYVGDIFPANNHSLQFGLFAQPVTVSQQIVSSSTPVFK